MIRILHRIYALLARISRRVSLRGGEDGRGYKARDEGPHRHTLQYVEEPDEAQLRHARILRSSRRMVRSAGLEKPLRDV
jgi:hypothetical protein